MSRRNMLIGLGLVGLFLFFHFSGGNKSRPSTARSTSTPTATRPFPAAAPTVTPEKHSSRSSPSVKKSPAKGSKAPPHEDEDETSNVLPDLRHKLTRVVRLYASWPGAIARSALLTKLRREEPFITEGTVRKIAAEWNNTPQSFMMEVKGVTMVSNLLSAGGNPNNATVTVFLNVVRRFKPASGAPYNQPGVQAYTVNLQVINRQWRAVAIAPEVPSSSSGA